MRLPPQGVEHRKLVRGELDLFGDEAVFAAGLVFGRYRQGIEDLAYPRRRHPIDDKGVEGVEGADREEAHRSALRRVRVDVIEMLKIRTVFQVAEQRHARRRGRDCGSDQSERCNERDEGCRDSAH